MVRVGVDLSGAQKGLKQAAREFDKAGKEMTRLGRSLTIGLTIPIVAAGTAAIKMASDTEESMNKVQVAFRSSARSVVDWSETTLKAYGIAQGTALDMASLFGDMATSMGLIPSEAAKMSMSLVGLAGDLSSFKNVDLEQVTLALRGVFTGEGEALKNLGVVMQDTTLKAYAQAKGYQKLYADMTQAEKVALRYSYIMDTTSIAQGDFARTSDGVANQTRMLKESVKELAAELGENLLPLVADALKYLNGLLEKFAGLDEGTQNTILKTAAAAAVIGPVLGIFGKATTGIGKVIKSLTKVPAATKGATMALGGLKGALAMLAGPLAAVGIGLAGIMIGKAYVDKKIGEMEEGVERLADGVEAAAERSKAKVADQYETQKQAIRDTYTEEEAASAKRLELYQEEYEAANKSAGKSLQVLRKSLQERQSALDDAHNAEIERIQSEYGVWEEVQKTKTDLVQEEADTQKTLLSDILDMALSLSEQEGKAYEDTYNAIIDKARDIHDEKMAMYVEEYQKSIALINQDLAKTVNGLQKEMDRIKGKKKEEEKLNKDTANKAKILELQARIDNAKTDTVRKAANAALADEINRQNKEREEEAQAILLESLQEQIDLAVEKAKEDKQKALDILKEKTGEQQIVIDAATQHAIDQIQAERKAKEDAENAKYLAAKAALDAEEEALDNYGDSYGDGLDAELLAKQKNEEEKLAAAKERMEKEIQIQDELMAEEQKKFDDIIRRMRLALEGITVHESDSGYEFGGGGRKIPGFANGVSDWQGGIARINEYGGEIRYLPSGATVIPHDISMAIASAIASTASQREGGMTLNFNGEITVRKDSDIDAIGKAIWREKQRADLVAGRV